jgi:hypothetical protein
MNKYSLICGIGSGSTTYVVMLVLEACLVPITIPLMLAVACAVSLFWVVITPND